MKNPSSKLVNTLIAKSIIETLLVAIIAVGFYVRVFPPTFHGWGEVLTESKSIAGWVVNDASPYQRVEVQLFVDGKFAATRVANLSRPDVREAGWAVDEWHGYVFQISNQVPGPHEARVYALHASGNGSRYTLQLLGNPIFFEVGPDGTWLPAITSHND